MRETGGKRAEDPWASGSARSSAHLFRLSGRAVASTVVYSAPGRNAAMFPVSYISIRKSVVRPTDLDGLFLVQT